MLLNPDQRFTEHDISNPFGERQAMREQFARWMRFVACDHGQDLVEYTLLLAFLALGTTAYLIGFSGSMVSVWQSASSVSEKGHHYAKGHDK
jgi:Flp pilus assembly pilin Flp